jgi:hypothetical protein
MAISLKIRKLQSKLTRQESFTEDAKEILKDELMEIKNVCQKIENSQNSSLTSLTLKNFTPIQDTKIYRNFFLSLSKNVKKKRRKYVNCSVFTWLPRKYI